jgi:hypothetical protein
LAFVERFEKFIHKGTRNGVQLVQKILWSVPFIRIIKFDYIKMQRRKIGAGFNDKIGIIHHRIAYPYKIVGYAVDSAFYGDFNGFVSCNLATENFIYNILPSAFIFIRNYRGKDEQQTEKKL